MTPAVYLVNVSEPIEPQVFWYLLSHIRSDKRERVLRQRIKQNADNMLVGEILAMVAIKRHFGIPLSEQHIVCYKNGKPYLDGFPDVHFNISHSGQCVVCAVCDVPVGIDIQEVVPYNPEVAKRVFSEDEIRQIDRSDDPNMEFTKMWAIMEARYKMGFR